MANPRFTKQPALIRNPHADVPLSAIMTFETNLPATATLHLTASERVWTSDVGGTPTIQHVFPVLGLLPGQDHRIQVSVSAGGDETMARTDLSLKVPDLPDEFPPYRVLRCTPERREPGLTFFNVGAPPMRDARIGKPHLIAIDTVGEIVFYRTSSNRARWLKNGNYLTFGSTDISEWDLAGNLIHHWHTSKHDPEAELPKGSVRIEWQWVMHHCLNELPDGNFLLLTESRHPEPQYPSSEVDPVGSPKERASVVGDCAVEVDRNTGEVIRAYDLYNILDPHRLCYNSLNQMRGERGGGEDTRDWTHCNSLIHDPRDDSFIFSARHQDAIIKIDRQTGDLKWILGDHGNWQSPWSEKLLAPQGDLSWQYHQHDLSITPEGHVLCFDNGNFRAVPPHHHLDIGKNYSRGVAFDVDEAAMTVSQAWAFGGPGDYDCYSNFVSGAQRLPQTGNTFLTYGGIMNKRGEGPVYSNAEANHCYARYLEVTPEGEIVFEAEVNDLSESNWVIYNSFRADHRPGFYPV